MARRTWFGGRPTRGGFSLHALHSMGECFMWFGVNRVTRLRDQVYMSPSFGTRALTGGVGRLPSWLSEPRTSIGTVAEGRCRFGAASRKSPCQPTALLQVKIMSGSSIFAATQRIGALVGFRRMALCPLM